MKIGLSTANYYPELNTEDIIDLYGKRGIKEVEIFLNTLSEMEEDYVKLLKEILDRNNMKCSSIHVMSAMLEPCLFDLHKRRREDYIKIYKKTLSAMKILDTKVYTFHGPGKYNVESSPLSHLADCYDRLNYLALEEGVFLAQENVFYLASGDPEFIGKIRNLTKEDMFFTLDIKQARRSGKKIEDFLKVMEGSIVNLHLSDYNKENTCLLPGSGMEDFKSLFKLMKERGYKGNGILELYRNNFKEFTDLVNSMNYLEREKDGET